MEKARDGSSAISTGKTAEDEGRRRGRLRQGAKKIPAGSAGRKRADPNCAKIRAIGMVLQRVRTRDKPRPLHCRTVVNSTDLPVCGWMVPRIETLIFIHNSENGGYLERIG
jgi:hypothetical protein